MANLAPVIKQRFFDQNGDPLVGGKLYSYLAGTSTPASTYADSSGSTPNENPLVLDENGEADIWLADTNYKFVLKDTDGVTQWTVDNISGSSGSSDSSGVGAWSEHALTDGQSATNMIGETVDLSLYSSAYYEYEIIRGTTIIANGSFFIQSVNGTGRILFGPEVTDQDHGITFSVSQASTTVQIKQAATSGPGNGTTKVRRSLVPA